MARKRFVTLVNLGGMCTLSLSARGSVYYASRGKIERQMSSAFCLFRKASAVGKVSLACRNLPVLACLTRECALSPGERLTASRLNVLGHLKKP